mmetsp:Transcript_25387/g.46868  ORF Transcript_25387/g.46868 Transcript_25387/m.46868 type:complete len:507 (+) Transcript_25387:91-1611(+)
MVYADENADHNAQPQAGHEPQKVVKQRLADAGADAGKSRKLGPSVAQWAAHERAPGAPRTQRTSRTVSGSPGPQRVAAVSTPAAAAVTPERSTASGRIGACADSERDEDGGTNPKASWERSLRGPSPGPAWRAHTTKPQGPNLRTALRSRSSSRGSLHANMGTPLMTPRGRSATPRAKSSDTHRTPKRKGRRSLSHWYAEASAPARVTAYCHELVTPKRRARSVEKASPAVSNPYTTGLDSEDGASLGSVGSVSRGIGSAAEMRSRLWQQIWIEKRRQQVNEMSSEMSTKSIHAPNFSTACCPPMQMSKLTPHSVGECTWLRSLRQSRSESPATRRTPSKSEQLNFATSRRARSRSLQRSASHTPERFFMSGKISGNATSRERAALEKHVERAFSVLQAKAQEELRGQGPVAAGRPCAAATTEVTPSESSSGTEPKTVFECQPPTDGAPQGEEWARQVASTHERAERARTLVEAKIAQVVQHERARVCVFKRPVAPATTSSTSTSE